MTLLKIHNLKKSFGGVKALNGCNFNIEKNKITALIGPNGCGKSTLFNVINKLEYQESGTITFLNYNISKIRPYLVSELGISRTFQYPTLFENLTIRDHIEMAMFNDDQKFFKSFFIKLFGLKKNNDKKIIEILNLVGLEKPLNTLGSDLSYGQRKLLDLAIAIAHPHKLIMLDEPVAGINPKLRQKIKEILIKLKEMGETIIVIEHDMNFIMDIADHVYVMESGQNLVEGKPKEIQNNKKVLEAYLGE
ncbi:ABC transporter ATP-binding protein [Candidatus Woesearchaeota archaeon]|jgi:ABC-type branched-subunit amino acid transport system ATPase component|nr:ABC transporter ATP-binding protein [Candidatus Woesearchaeota archaeon]MBT4387422.1 ABC transporter ATP-binding protein [Candidatus Woesearchaeota archaeon]MBT4595799.1 ABC transporter ATP-binding protein [Candidatus Woesearchaeota archaeon]MBT5741352.1 ABC transporter ATP-binding protein [Candidatus Woesearchaeota archaeon]MBT7297092.1 ABC transporter ATP-binding protein [Candidatus Woesearchaeota archaeon]